MIQNVSQERIKANIIIITEGCLLNCNDSLVAFISTVQGSNLYANDIISFILLILRKLPKI